MLWINKDRHQVPYFIERLVFRCHLRERILMSCIRISPSCSYIRVIMRKLRFRISWPITNVCDRCYNTPATAMNPREFPSHIRYDSYKKPQKSRYYEQVYKYT